MPAAVTGFFGRLKKTWDEFSLPQRTLVILGLAVLALGVAALVTWTSRPTLSPVFTNLSAEDASAVVDQLEAEGVTYELAAGGSTVLVPAEQLYDLRISLAASGLPTSQDGYSLLDDMSMTSSDFQQQVTYQRALEGELARTIESINGVNTSTVHLALPEESVFVDRAVDPTASVFVQLETGATMDNNAVQAVVNLVSSSVPHMEPTGVSVIDAEGSVLTATGAGGPGGGGDSDYEDGVRGAVQAMLDQVVGPGNAVVAVQAEFSRDATERVTETFTPAEGAPPLSESTSTEEYTGGGQVVGGVLGPDNIAVPNEGAEDGTYTREDSVLNNPVNKVTEQTTINPGGVSRQSVSVIVDAQAGAGIDLLTLERMVTAAAGIDAERGDVVEVSRMAFDSSAAEAAEEALTAAEEAAEAEREAALLRQLIIAAVALVVVLVIAVMVRRARRERREEIDLAELRLLEAESFGELTTGDETMALDAPPVPAALAARQPTAADDARAEIAALATADPAVVAKQLREWLAVRR
ncbi:flagellar basal-body MS-ring/collar protein FliF [Georgenia subflava]|uniref:Flagellar M-ring protein n=1 Tax=Georgenia subflava TaxID=1622177 RepID=A0A6N7EQL8_9MICO|nr:flagellar basal-body MS-ring/collar protein FliF [Georgenia subflava]MPV38436.1 flagellar M-ring protein FliF [Georgenia subflava]